MELILGFRIELITFPLPRFQTGLLADAMPLVGKVLDVARGGTGGKEERAILAVSRDGVDHRAGGA